VLPIANFEAARDEMRILQEEGVCVHPIRNVAECLEVVFGVSEQGLIGEIKERYETAAMLTQRA
jgi:hypothetical protein